MQVDKIKELLKTKEYRFLKDNKYLGDNIMLITLGGSIAYGTNLPTSDVDIRGIALNPSYQIFGLLPDFEQVVDTNTDTTIYSLNKMVKLLIGCNPNTLEILGCIPKHYLYVNDFGQLILDNASNFLSIKAIDTFGGYARQQYNRLEHGLLGNGANDDKKIAMMKHSMESVIKAFNIKHKTNQLDLTLDIITEKGNPDLWSRYRHTDKCIEIGEDLVMSGTFNAYPISEFKTILSELHKVNSEYGNINKRNTKKTDDGLCKHMTHLIRLYKMGEHLNKYGVIKTHWDGKDLEDMMDIRLQKYMYPDGKRVRPEFYELLKSVQDSYNYSLENTVLNEKPNIEAINEMLLKIYKVAYGLN